jgi:Flp pilus assembly pilin Flp
MQTRFVRNQKGFTLIEALMAAGLGAVVLFGVFTVHQTMMKTQVSSNNNLEVVDMRYEIAGLFSKVDNCTSLLAGKASVAGTAVPLSTSLREGGSYGKLNITSIRLQNIVDLGDSKRNAKIQILGTRDGKNQIRSDITELINVYYIVNASNQIVTCKDNANVCTSMGGIWKTDHCDFCTNLGGVVKADGTCGKSGP